MYSDGNDSKTAGTVGAVSGALLGIGIWCLIGLLGRIAVVGGIAISLGALGGYFLFGRGMSKAGFIISLIVILISVYNAAKLNYCITMSGIPDEGLTFRMCYNHFYPHLELYGMSNNFFDDLKLGYFLAAVGGMVLFFKKFFRGTKVQR